MAKVEIGKVVTYEKLEKALIEAAEEVGWNARVEDEFRKSYNELFFLLADFVGLVADLMNRGGDPGP